MANNSRKKRLDMILLDRGLAESREQAQSFIMAGLVSVKGQKATKPGTSFPQDTDVALAKRKPYVSRGGFKLAHALETFEVDSNGITVLDVGASTGGFTDCLIQNGARRVYAMDVGKNQINYRLRHDDRVVVMEGVNAHFPFQLPGIVSMTTIDVSFISVTKVIPNVLEHLPKHGIILVLIKPQFEAHQSEVGKAGIIRNPKVHAKVLARIILWAITNGLRIRNLTPSPILGARGNREFFLMMEWDKHGI